MKHHINKLVIAVIISFFILQFGKGATEATETEVSKDLLTLVSRLESENIEVDEWSIHAREKLETLEKQEDVEKYVNTLKERFPKWDWTIQKNEHHWEAMAAAPDTSHYQESIKIVSTPTNQISQTYVIYEIKGHAWADHTESFLKKDISYTFSRIFRGDFTIFSCIKAELDDNINSSLSLRVDQLLTSFKAKEIESLSENTFVSVSAASPLFAESLGKKQKGMNLQLALRTQGLGAKTSLVIGTPIITIEY